MIVLMWELHIMNDTVTEDDLKYFYASTVGHKWFDYKQTRMSVGRDHDRVFKVSETPRVIVGDDAPDFVMYVISEVDDGVTVITPSLIAKWHKAYDTLPNTTAYDQCDWEPFEAFLRKHINQHVFCYGD